MSGKALAAGADRMHNLRLAPCGSLNNTSLSPGRAGYNHIPFPRLQVVRGSTCVFTDSTGFYVQLPIGFEGKIECGRIIV